MHLINRHRAVVLKPGLDPNSLHEEAAHDRSTDLSSELLLQGVLVFFAVLDSCTTEHGVSRTEMTWFHFNDSVSEIMMSKL